MAKSTTFKISLYLDGSGDKPKNKAMTIGAERVEPGDKNILRKRSYGRVDYFLPSIIHFMTLFRIHADFGKYSIKKNIERSIAYLNKEIEEATKNSDIEKIEVYIYGYSRGGTMASRVYQAVRMDQIKNKKVKLFLVSTDPIPSPFQPSYNTKVKVGGKVTINASEKGTINPNNKTDEQKNPDTILSDSQNKQLSEYIQSKSVVILTTLYNHAPQQVLKANIILIVPSKHVGAFGTKTGSEVRAHLYQRYGFYNKNDNNKFIPLEELPNLPNGVYLSDKNFYFEKINKSDFSKIVKVASENKSHKRTDTIIAVSAKSLELTPGEVIEKVPKYRRKYNEILVKINNEKP